MSSFKDNELKSEQSGRVRNQNRSCPVTRKFDDDSIKRNKIAWRHPLPLLRQWVKVNIGNPVMKKKTLYVIWNRC